MTTQSPPIIKLEEVFVMNQISNVCLSRTLESENAYNKLNSKHMELRELISQLQRKISIFNQEYWMIFAEIYSSYYIWIDNNFDEFVRLIPNEVVGLALNAYGISKSVYNSLHDIVFSLRQEDKLLECIYILSKYCNRCALHEELISFGFDVSKHVMSIPGLRCRIIAEKCVENMNKINNKYSNNIGISEFWTELCPHYIKLYTHLCDNFQTLFLDPTCEENLEKWKVMAYEYENAYYRWSEDLIFTSSEKKLQKDVLRELKKYCRLMQRAKENNKKKELLSYEISQQ